MKDADREFLKRFLEDLRNLDSDQNPNTDDLKFALEILIKTAIDISRLETRVRILTEIVILLAHDCKCSVEERLSGHLADCPTPTIKALLSADDD